MIVNNRPDGEDPGQPLSADIEAAAKEAGIDYRFLPIRRGTGPADVEEMQEAMRECGDGKLLAFCRSGSALDPRLGARPARGRGRAARSSSGARPKPASASSPIAHLL